MFKNIVLATDGSQHAMRAAEVAADIAVKYGARLIIINVFATSLTLDEVQRMPQAARLPQEVKDQLEPAWISYSQTEIYSDAIPVPAPAPYAVLMALSNEIMADAERIAKVKGARDIALVSVQGKPAEQIIEQFKKQNGDLIVLGTRGLSDVAGLVMGSVSHKVIHMATCPCLLVK